MGALPVIADVYRCALRWQDSASGQRAVNVIHVRKHSSTADAVFADLDGNAHHQLWECTATTASVVGIDITPLDGITATTSYLPNPDGRWAGPTTGQATIAPAVMVKLRTIHRGRSYRGRLFLPFVAEAAQNQGFISVGDQGVQQTAWRLYASNLEAAGSTIVVASYKAVSATDVSSIDVELALGTVRRRQQRNR